SSRFLTPARVARRRVVVLLLSCRSGRFLISARGRNRETAFAGRLGRWSRAVPGALRIVGNCGAREVVAMRLVDRTAGGLADASLIRVALASLPFGTRVISARAVRGLRLVVSELPRVWGRRSQLRFLVVRTIEPPEQAQHQYDGPRDTPRKQSR